MAAHQENSPSHGFSDETDRIRPAFCLTPEHDAELQIEPASERATRSGRQTTSTSIVCANVFPAGQSANASSRVPATKLVCELTAHSVRCTVDPGHPSWQ